MATQTGTFKLTRTEPTMLTGTFESVYEKNVGDDPSRTVLAAFLVEACAHAPQRDKLAKKHVDLYKSLEASLAAGTGWNKASEPLWHHVMGGGFESPGEPVTTVSVGVDDPSLLDFLPVGESMEWDSYRFG